MRPYRILRFAPEDFDLEVALHPLEKQFDLPASFVEIGDLLRGEDEVVREEDVGVLRLLIIELHAPQEIGVVLIGLRARQTNRLIAAQSRRSIDGSRVETLPLRVPFRSRDEETTFLVNGMESLKIEVTSVQDIARTGLNGQDIEDIHVMHRSVCDVDKRWQIAPQVEEGMGFHRSFRFPEMCPREDRQTEINGGGIECVEPAVKTVEKGIIILVERTSTLDERLREGFVDPPVPLLIGVVQGGEFDGTREAQVVQLFRMGVETENDAACTLAKRELPEDETQELLPARKRFHRMITSKLLDALLECVTRENARDLAEDVGAGVHAKRRKCGLIFRFPIEMSENKFSRFSSCLGHIIPIFMRFFGNH